MGVTFRFMHAADLHVDSPFRGLTDAPAHVREALQMSTFQAVRNLVDTALSEAVDFVVIAGDLYDSADRSLRAQLYLQREWQRLHANGVQLFVIHGNHDPLSGQRAKLEWPESVYFFGTEKVEKAAAYTKSGELAAYVHGISYGTRSVTDNLAAKYYADNGSGVYQIAMLHGNVDGQQGHDPYAPCSLSELAGSAFHYWALGHIHQREVLHTFPHVVYSGNTQGRHSKETGAKGAYIVDVSASFDTELKFVPLDTVRWENAVIEIDGIESEQALLGVLEQAIASVAAGCERRSCMLRLSLQGRGPLHHQLSEASFMQELLHGIRVRISDLHESLDDAAEPWCWVYQIDALSGAEIDYVMLAREDSFTGELIRSSLIIEADEAALGELANEALQSLYANTRLRKLALQMQGERSRQWLVGARELAAGLLIEDSPLRMTDKQAESGLEGGDKA
ncbi:DNA repair exonuclease [Paenibacillus sp. OV219]|uniref:metallophosphoesterase family protein n=1 Tax=Paenibacillus sp. OV219 TaxID=1884377 RepID=UPI0008AAA0BE|nr:DNA repair exonuclease [Paenibacillus sp. OV219]SEM71952.1 DNA repair exonuclease SbcCD nuclease subunit [Paenibacillus sp. OV219]